MRAAEMLVRHGHELVEKGRAMLNTSIAAALRGDDGAVEKLAGHARVFFASMVDSGERSGELISTLLLVDILHRRGELPRLGRILTRTNLVGDTIARLETVPPYDVTIGSMRKAVLELLDEPEPSRGSSPS